MRALRFHKVGSLDELKVEELPRQFPRRAKCSYRSRRPRSIRAT